MLFSVKPMGRDIWGRFKGEGIYVYLWLIHVEVRQKLLCFKLTILLSIFLHNNVNPRRVNILPILSLCSTVFHLHVWLLVTPWTVAHQAPLSMGFSRQEYWRGLPCPPPVDLPDAGTEPMSPTLQADSLPSEPSGKPKNTGVGSLSLLLGNLLTQELNQGLQHCRWILYKLNY